MNKIVFDNDLLKLMSLFESLTGAKLRDCAVEEKRALFVVEEGQIGRAIGSGGSNIRRVEKALNRKIKIVEFNPKAEDFIRNLFYPAKIKGISEAEGQYTITAEDLTSRGFIIGKGASNLRFCEGIAKRYFEIKEIKVR